MLAGFKLDSKTRYSTQNFNRNLIVFKSLDSLFLDIFNIVQYSKIRDLCPKFIINLYKELKNVQTESTTNKIL